MYTKGNYLDSYSLFISLVAVVAGHRTSPTVHVQSSTHHLIKRRRRRRSNNIYLTTIFDTKVRSSSTCNRPPPPASRGDRDVRTAAPNLDYHHHAIKSGTLSATVYVR
eukprot:COSAG05_NODE_8887_length_664_cov_1.322124_1_plen_107_part_10